MQLKIWEIHSKSCKIEKAEKSCKGLANQGAVQWCGPYVNANQYGFWVYPPVDMDFSFENGNFKVTNMEGYDDEDYRVVRSLIRPEDHSDFEKWIFPNSGRTKVTFGSVEPNVVQIWTGLIFQTPPGWCLHIRSPINFPQYGFNVMEAVLETDWLQYDIWMNLSVTEVGKIISIRKDTPIAQLVPVRREGFKGDWDISRERINRDSTEADKVFSYWLHYNKQKFEFGGKQALTQTLTKDSTTYFREKSRLLGKEMEPLSDVEKCPAPKPNKCPFAHMHPGHQETPEFEALDNSFIKKFFKKS
jgi:hypothetical protein